jgi:hypothetical protein
LSSFFILRDIIFDESAMLKAYGDAPEPIIKENKKVQKKVEFDLLVQQGDEKEFMSYDIAHLEE